MIFKIPQPADRHHLGTQGGSYGPRFKKQEWSLETITNRAKALESYPDVDKVIVHDKDHVTIYTHELQIIKGWKGCFAIDIIFNGPEIYHWATGLTLGIYNNNVRGTDMHLAMQGMGDATCLGKRELVTPARQGIATGNLEIIWTLCKHLITQHKEHTDAYTSLKGVDRRAANLEVYREIRRLNTPAIDRVKGRFKK